MTVGLALGIALSLGFVVLSLLVMNMRQELRTTQNLLRQVVEKIPTQAATGESVESKPTPTEWPVNASLHPGDKVPSPISKKAKVNWSVLVFAPRASDAQTLLNGDRQREKLARRYQIFTVVAKDDVSALSSTVSVTVSPDAMKSLPTPAIAMVDPDSTIQGIALANTTEELLAFVHEGEHHGFGPLGSPQDYNEVDESVETSDSDSARSTPGRSSKELV